MNYLFLSLKLNQAEYSRCAFRQVVFNWLARGDELFKISSKMEKQSKKIALFSPNILVNSHGLPPETDNNRENNNPPEEYSIYNHRSPSEAEEPDSSFELEPEVASSQHQKDNLDKLLDRLGLREQLKTKSDNQELQLVVNNFLEHCIGTVDRKANTEQYDLIYDSGYQEKVKSFQNNSGTIFISELTELEKIRMVPDTGLWVLYRRLRLICKYVSMLCQKIVQHALFEAFILVVILLNSLKMATDDPLATTTNLPEVETAFTAIYVTEMTIKIFAYGFVFGQGSYLRDLWNILDFVIVVTSLLPLIMNIGFSVNALRAIRVLRPLRTITKVKALKMIVKTLFNSFSLVMDSLIILFMVMGIFAIAGMQLFGGFLKYTCMDEATGFLSSTLCSTDGDCPSTSICVKGISSPNFSIINFDTLLWSFLSVFQTITCEGWSLIMMDIQQVKGLVYSLYSFLIVVTCLYILLNMTMAILKYKYSQVKSNRIEEEEEELQEYEPEFLKKIGIFQQISALSETAPLARINHPFRQQVGCSLTLPAQEKMITMTTKDLVAHLDARKASESVQQIDPDQIDLKEIRQLGKYQDPKWDANNLVFETLLLEEKEGNGEKVDHKGDSEKSLQQKEEVSLPSDEEGSDFSQISSEEEESSESSNDIEIADKVLELQKKLNHSVKDIGTSKTLKRLEGTSSPKIQEKVNPKRELSEFDQLLELIGSKPGRTHRLNQDLQIPEIDFTEINPDRIYERFADLGEYRMKRAEQRIKLGSLEVAKKNMKGKAQMKKSAPVQEVVEQNALEIKQLHLKNELLKMRLRCRVKSDQLIEEERKYDTTRVIVSQKLKEIELKKNQIKENMNSMHYSVRYRLNRQKSKTEELRRVYSRNLENEKSILKVPEIENSRELLLHDTHENETETVSKVKDNNHYLKMLQNHQMEQKIELKLDRIMAAFFKKENPRRKTKGEEKKEEKTAEEEYEAVHQDDILKRHGHLELEYPFATLQQEESLERINMKNQEYEIHIKGLLGMLRVARKKLFLIVSHSAYDNFVLLVVFLNTALMAINGYVATDVPPYSYINEAFTFIFITDLSLKIFAYGTHFFGDGLNLFDAAVVSVSIIQLVMGGDSTSNLSALRSIRILRAFRVLRITRLIRSLSYMRIIMGVVTSIITEFIYVFLLLSLFVFIYTLLGMQIFGGNFPSSTVTGIRQNYDTFFNALFTIFQVMTVQNWNDIEVMTVTSSIGTYGLIFLLSWIFLGNWILLNLLQAILLDGFDGDSINPEQEVGNVEESNSTLPNEEEPPEEDDEAALLSKGEERDSSKEDTMRGDEQASLFMFKPDHPLRVVCKAIATSTVFEVAMFIIILCSSGKLAFDTYIDTSSSADIQTFSTIANYVFNGLFLFESLIKIIHLGFVMGDRAYLSNSWNKLDFGIVCISIIDMSLTGVNLSIFKLLRTLRPLRIITRNEEMKIMVTSLAQSFLGIFNVLIICLCVFLMFAILGMNLLQGKLNYCNTGGSKLVTGNYGPYDVDQTACVAGGGEWTTQLINFQNVGNSMISLYVFSTRENWPFYVYTFIDSSDTGPVKDNSQVLYFVFAVLFIFIGSLFFMDLLVGVMFMNYHQAEGKIRPKTLSNKQINWQNLQKLIVSEDPCFQLYLSPSSQPRKFLFELVSSRSFEILIGVVILANILVMTIANDDISADMSNTLTTLNSVFSYIFILELSLKIVAYGKYYFLSGWNIFDFFVVSASVLDIILQYSGISNGGASQLSILPQIARIFRVLRITRLLRMVKSFKGLQKLIETFVFSLPAIGKGLMILLLYLFVSSILASNLMGNIASDFGGNMNQVLNYGTFFNAFETLFVNLTGENWYYYMFFSAYPGFVTCSDGTSTSCVSSLNLLFWLPFVFLGQKVFLQLFVLIVLDQFEANYINENNPLGVYSLFEDDFRENWIKATPKYHSEKIEAKRLIDLMLTLRPPLGLGREETLRKYEEELASNQKISKEQVADRVHETDKKLKKSAARLLHKMNVMKNRIYFGYHETFYNFAKLSIVPQFIDEATPAQREALENMHRESELALEKVKPAGNLFYYSELQGEEQDNVPLNPISLILFTQIIIKSWHNYSHRNQAHNSSQQQKGSEPYDSLDNSCASDLSQADFEKIANDRKVIMRRGGLIANALDNGATSCEFRPTPNMCAAYGEGKRTKHKVSIMKKSRSSLQGILMKKTSSRERDIIRVSKGHAP